MQYIVHASTLALHHRFCPSFCRTLLQDKARDYAVKSAKSSKSQGRSQGCNAPLIGLLFANILVLTLWTAISPLNWTREFTGAVDVFDREVESFGGCLVGADRSYIPYIV